MVIMKMIIAKTITLIPCASVVLEILLPFLKKIIKLISVTIIWHMFHKKVYTLRRYELSLIIAVTMLSKL